MRAPKALVALLAVGLAACQAAPSPIEPAGGKPRRGAASPLPLARALVLEGTADVAGEALAGADVQAFDLATGASLGNGGQ
ncbi:MAG: hypothetical protein VKQ33_02985, partial [Candidatus Sericytochromatia bacterium]|nr:hypothetical protein [Candidatus Sericytochromatia bacterium]